MNNGYEVNNSINENIKGAEKEIADLLGVCLGNVNTIRSVTEEKEISEIAKEHGVLTLLYSVRERFSLDNRTLIEKESQKAVKYFYRQLYLTNYVVSLLSKASVETVVIKGVDTASFYPEEELRISGDIDLLLLNPKCLEKAKKTLLENGFETVDSKVSPHHLVVKYDGKYIVEIHTSPTRPFDSAKINNIVANIFKPENIAVKRKEICGFDFPVLDEEMRVIFNFLHMLNHFLSAGFGLKTLCDWSVIWMEDYEEPVYEKYKEFVNELRVSVFSDTLIGVCEKYLGLPKEKGSKVRFSEAETKLVDELFMEIIDSGCFGNKDEARMVSLRNPSLKAMIKEFNHQAKNNYPKASKWIVTMPVLWIMTFVVFQKNNKKRNISMENVIKNARERSVLTNRMKIWEK